MYALYFPFGHSFCTLTSTFPYLYFVVYIRTWYLPKRVNAISRSLTYMHFLGSNLLKIESAETNPKSVYSMASVLVRPPFQICEKIILF